MGDGVFGYPERKHGSKIKKCPFADIENLPYNPPHLIVQAFISFTSIPPACISPTPIPHASGTFSIAPATNNSFIPSIWTISTAIPHIISHIIPSTVPLAISRTIPHAIPATILATILSSIPNSLRISPNHILNALQPHPASNIRPVLYGFRCFPTFSIPVRISPNLVLNSPLILISRLIFRILGVFCVFSAF